MKTRKLSTEKEYIELIKELIEHDKRYYEKAQPTISDYEYDLLTKEVERFEKENPHLIHKDSPTKRVNEPLSEGFKKGKHETPMLSLANTYSEEELASFIKRVHKLLEKSDVPFCAELKMDGTAISVRYEKGKLVRALTRGNGKVGDVITENCKTIRSIPHTLKGDFPDVLEMRGEVFMHVPTFQKLNEEREEEGLDPWANPRNAAAGSLKLLDPKEVAKRKLDVVFYGIAHGDKIVSSQYEVHKFLKKIGMPTSKEKHFAKVHDLEEILAFADAVQEERDRLTFEIDGIVLKVDELKMHDQLGFTGKSPRYAAAYKFQPEQAETVIEGITVQVGRTGVLTPVAELKPVFLAGSTIARATLHNEDEIKRKDIRVHDTVIIEKGGDVIPKVVKVDESKRPKNSKPWRMPERCPICKEKTEHFEGEVAHRCTNPACPGQNLKHIIFFASKAAMEIEHLGEKIVEQLIDEGLISRISDIYRLEEEDLRGLEGFQDKAIENLLTSIETSKTRPLARLILGLGIKYVGAETAELLADAAGSIDSLIEMEMEELLDIDGIGEKVAQSIIEFFNTRRNLEEIDLLYSFGVKPFHKKKKKVTDHTFSGKIFVLTGTLEKYSRKEATDLIQEKGGKVTGSVSKKTDFLLAGENPGSKFEKAEKLGVKILTEKMFEKELGG